MGFFIIIIIIIIWSIARPTQCRTFPWWPQNLISDYDWQLTARDCEGISLPLSVSPESSPPPASAIHPTPTYTFDDILPEVILHDVSIKSSFKATLNQPQRPLTFRYMHAYALDPSLGGELHV